MPLQFTTLASDTFGRANENPLSGGGKWTTPVGVFNLDGPFTFNPMQIVSDQCEGTVLTVISGAINGALYKGIAWPENQWAQVTLTGAEEIGILVRATDNGVTTSGYLLLIQGGFGARNGTAAIDVVNAGNTQISDTANLTFSLGDIILFAALDSTLYIFQNGSLIATATDTTFSSGEAGVFAASDTTLSASSFHNFVGGSVALLPSSGFSPNWYEGQLNAGLAIYVSPGVFGGANVNGQIVFVPANSTSYLYLSGSGVVQVGASLPSGAYGIAIVVSGPVQTSGNGPASIGMEVTSEGILSITDIRS